METPLNLKLRQLEDYVERLERYLLLPSEDIWSDVLGNALERMIQLVVECGADAGDLWLGAHNRPLGQSAMGVFQNLRTAGVIDAELLNRFRVYVRTRNRIIHDYDQVSHDEVRAQAEGLAKDVTRLVQALLAHPDSS
jgi:uncharacterized protein YutE (UPF0331/DUF86 family)